MSLAIAIHPELAKAFPSPVPAESPDGVTGRLGLALLTVMATRSEVLGAPLVRTGWLERVRSRPAGCCSSEASSRCSSCSSLGSASAASAVAPSETVAILAHRLFGLDIGGDLVDRRPRRSSSTSACPGSCRR